MEVCDTSTWKVMIPFVGGYELHLTTSPVVPCHSWFKYCNDFAFSVLYGDLKINDK